MAKLSYTCIRFDLQRTAQVGMHSSKKLFEAMQHKKVLAQDEHIAESAIQRT